MGISWIGMDARYTSTEVLGEGETAGDDLISTGSVGLVFGGDDAVVIEGTPRQVRKLLTAALAKLDAAHPGLVPTEPALPELPEPVADDDEEAATCPYVYTEADAQAVRKRNADYVAQMREMHGDDANIYEETVPVPGEVCGGDLMLWDKEPVVRYLYTRDGEWIAGPSKGGDDGGGDEEVNCSKMHYWAVPEIDEWQ